MPPQVGGGDPPTHEVTDEGVDVRIRPARLVERTRVRLERANGRRGGDRRRRALASSAERRPVNDPRALRHELEPLARP
jgi:hypothetical protein